MKSSAGEQDGNDGPRPALEDHVRMAAVFVLLPAMAFVGPLVAVLGLAVVLFLLPDDDSSDGDSTGTT